MRQPSSKEDTQSLVLGGISSNRHIAHAHKRLLVWVGLLPSARASWLAGLGASTVCLSVLVCGSVCQSVLERERGEERQLVSRAIVSTSARHLIALRLLQVSLEV